MADRLDEELMSAAGGGDREAFGILVERHQRAIMHFVYRFLAVADSDAAEDLVQDVFLAAWKSASSFRPRPGVKVLSWLLRIATNTCLNYRRRSRLRVTVAMDADGDVGVHESGFPKPDEGILSGERARQVKAAIADLPPAQRAAIVLREFHGLSYAEIAEVIDTSVSAVESILVRARRTLGAALADQKIKMRPKVSPEPRVEFL